MFAINPFKKMTSKGHNKLKGDKFRKKRTYKEQMKGKEEING